MSFPCICRGIRLLALAVLLAGCSVPLRPDLARMYRVAAISPDDTPVILIPGLFGSKLRQRPSGAEVWPGTWDRVLFFAAVITAMTLALNGLAVGLGVLFPNFKDANPGKIVSGFGGTLCLVLSFLYILASVVMLAYGTAGREPRTDLLAASVCGFVLLSAVVGWLPLKLGLRQVGKLEV